MINTIITWVMQRKEITLVGTGGGCASFTGIDTFDMQREKKKLERRIGNL